MKDCKLVYIGFAFEHHKKTHAGYHQIAEYLPYDKKISAQRFFDKCCKKRTLLGKICRCVVCFCTSFSSIPFFLVNCIRYGYKFPNTVFHFIYGENLLNNIKPYLAARNKIVCTFHQPFSWFEENPRFLKLLKSIDAIILVGDAEVQKFQNVTGKKNVFFIPHGICTNFYKPNPMVKKEHMLLTVGSWLRDYDFADRVYQKLLAEDSELEINVVSSREICDRLTKNPRLHLHSGISDEQLKDLYCRCSILYLPLIRYTANNALLEAGATGCNIVVSSDFPDNSYIPERYIVLARMDLDDTVKKIKGSFRLDYNVELSEYVNEHFAWNVVAEKTKEILKNVGF